MKKLYALLFLIVIGCPLIHAQTIYYATPTGAGTGNGSSWANAYNERSFKTSLAAAAGGTVFYVAAGTYHPAATAQDSSFYIPSGVKVYGGFPATGNPTFANRDYVHNITVLSGEIGNTNDLTDNSWHVLRFNLVDSTTVLDGITVTGAYADGNNDDNNGGGIYNDAYNSNIGSSPTIINCTITHNTALGIGGGMYNNATGGGHTIPNIINCTFSNNNGGSGGAIGNYAQGGPGACSPVISQCRFVSNTATADGGGITFIANYNAGSSYPKISNSLFIKNRGPVGGALRNYIANSSISINLSVANCTFVDDSSTNASTGSVINSEQFAGTCTSSFVNCIMWNSTSPNIHDASSTTTATYSDIGYVGTGNINSDPLFLDASGGDYRIGSCSPCVNAGTAAGAPSVDIVNDLRPVLGAYDMGAYESPDTGMIAAAVSITAGAGDSVCPNTLLTFTASDNIPVGASFQWKLNGNNVGGDSASYTTVGLPQGASLICAVSTTASCFSSANAASNAIIAYQYPRAGFSYANAGNTFVFTDTSSYGSSVEWYFGDGDSVSSVNPSHTYATDGSYIVKEVVSNPCTADSVLKVVHVTTGISTLDAGADITLYPNPASQFCVMHLAYGSYTLSMTDMQGREIRVGNFSGDTYTMPVSQYAKGLYLLKISASTGSLAIRKLVIE